MSTILKAKSESNLLLAQKIINERTGFYHSSIHCLYYSCFQLMLHICSSDLTVKNFNEESLDKKKGPHEKMIDKFVNCFVNKQKRFLAADFNNEINKLKILRHKADYKNIEISESKAIEAEKATKTIITHLTNTFTI